MTHNVQLTARHLTEQELDERAKRIQADKYSQAVKDEYVRLMQLKEANSNGAEQN